MSDLAGLVVFRDPLSDASGYCAPERDPPPRAFSADYLRARERAERAAAKRAQSLAARQVHQELAQHYAELAKAAG